jgi:hypothetical protein
MKEIAGKMIVCNIHRHLQLYFLKVFYRAKNSNLLLLGNNWMTVLLVLDSIRPLGGQD